MQKWLKDVQAVEDEASKLEDKYDQHEDVLWMACTELLVELQD